jgi:hypothetical protein
VVQHLNRFQNDWWALGQHHGLQTPLLDWTSSPYVALFFAFMTAKPDDTSRRVVFALGQAVVESRSREIEKDHVGTDPPPIVEFHRPLSDENARLVNQGGLFTRSPIGTHLESWVRQNFQGRPFWVLAKITIPNKDREECLKELNRMNINYLTLFPDMYGASQHCNTKLNILEY